MFETLKVESTNTFDTINATKKGNPFSIRAIVGHNNGKFTGVSFIEVFRGNVVVKTGAYCSDYGIEHSYTGADADKLDALVAKLNADIEQQYGITFLVREAPQEFSEPTPPENMEE